MRILLTLLVPLLLVACGPAPTAPGGVANGMAIGADFDGAPWTIGQGDLKGNALVVTYFATW